MLYSNKRKQALCGWMKHNDSPCYEHSLKLQKFLLFYEAFSKIDNDDYDFSRLRGYKRGPVFSNVWGDYTKDRYAFDQAATSEYETNGSFINEERALKADFLVKILSETELSELTHKLDLWKSKQTEILSGKKNVNLAEKNFSQNDQNFFKELEDLYSKEFILDSFVMPVNNKYFVFSKCDAKQLNAEHLDVLEDLSKIPDLMNPVMVKINKGILEID